MEDESTIAILPARRSGLAVAVVVGVILLAGGLAWLISQQKSEYQAEARLSYKAAADLPTGSDGAVKLAERVLDDVQLGRTVTRFDLFADQGQKETSQQLAGQLRRSIHLTNAGSGNLVVAYRGGDAQQTVSVTNELSRLLADYSLTSQVQVPVAESPQVTQQVTKPEPAPAPVSLNVAPVVTSRTPRKRVKVDTAALKAQVSRIDAALVQLANARNTLAGQLQDVGGRLKAAVAAKNVDGTKVEQLQAEEQGMVNDLGRTDAAAAEERYKKAHILEQIKKAGTAADDVTSTTEAPSGGEAPQKAQPAAAAQPVPAAPAASVGSASPGEANRATQPRVEEKTIVVQPFHLVQAASRATELGMSKVYEWAALGGGTLILLILCFVPLIPAEHVGEEIDHRNENVPEHVTYLGGDRR